MASPSGAFNLIDYDSMTRLAELADCQLLMRLLNFLAIWSRLLCLVSRLKQSNQKTRSLLPDGANT
jgi:hypothetical protein